MTIADYIVRYLAARGVSHVFEVAGGMICPLLDAAHRNGAPKLVSMNHEQGAGFAAEGFARMMATWKTPTPGVAFATSGPGATNLVTAIASCYFDSTPAVFITGQVAQNELKGAREETSRMRQLGFQETDIVSIVKPITKYAGRWGGWTWFHTPGEIARMLDLHFADALSDRPGPVLIDIPFDMQRETIDEKDPVGADPGPGWSRGLNMPEIAGVLEILRAAERPLVLVGGGAVSSPSLPRLLMRLGVPVVNSLLGTGILHYDHPYRVGMIGTYGNRAANKAIMRSSALLVLGSRLDVRQTGASVESFVEGKTIIRVDVDRGESRVKGSVWIDATVEEFCQAALSTVGPGDAPAVVWPQWSEELNYMKRRWAPWKELNGVIGEDEINPNTFMFQLGVASPDAAAFVVDVGQHQMWAAQSLYLRPGQRFLTSGGHGAMGFALPAAIGAHYATGRPIVCIAGDGGFQVNVQELWTIARENLPIRIVVVNNGSHGMVRQFQEEVFGGRLVSTVHGSPSFASIARAYGIPSYVASKSAHILDALEWLGREPNEPRLLEVIVPAAANAWPKTHFGSRLDEMDPKEE